MCEASEVLTKTKYVTGSNYLECEYVGLKKKKKKKTPEYDDSVR